MQDYKIKIKLKSTIITPFQSDTIFGHICWALRYVKGEKYLLDFLSAYDNGDPPLVISSAFPEGYLPYPVLPPMDKSTSKRLIEQYWGQHDFLSGVNGLKKLSNIKHISKDILENMKGHLLSNWLIIGQILDNPRICPKTVANLPAVCSAKYSDDKITCPYISSSKKDCPSEYLKTIRKTEITYHAKINRLSGTAIDGGLFTTEDTFYGTDGFECYCKIGSNFSEEALKKCLQFINRNGFGRKKSSGKGSVCCTLESRVPESPFDDSNAFMTLSNYVPKTDDPERGFYNIFTKYGKLGGHFASSPLKDGLNPMPFKYPLIMFEPRSVFIVKEARSYYGRMIKGIHSFSDIDITHYGLAYPLPVKVEVSDE